MRKNKKELPIEKKFWATFFCFVFVRDFFSFVVLFFIQSSQSFFIRTHLHTHFTRA